MTFIDEINKMNLETAKGERFNDDDLFYIDTLFTAINNIKQRYLKRITLLSNGEEVEVVERAYSSELKVQIYTCFNDKFPNSNPLGLYCDHEGSKTFYTKLWDTLFGDDKYPDIIIHKSDLPENGIQEIVCEIKRFSRLGAVEMLIDINKLIAISGCEIWNGYGYRIPVFLVSNSTRAQLEKKIRRFGNSKYTISDLLYGKNNKEMTFFEYVTENQERLKNILCFCHSEEGKVEYCSVFEVVKSQIIH